MHLLQASVGPIRHLRMSSETLPIRNYIAAKVEGREAVLIASPACD